jgi:hypothetical protein
MNRPRRLFDAAALGCAILGATARAPGQEPFFMDAATHPSRGVTTLRGLATHEEQRADDLFRARLKAAHGLRSDLALLGEWGWNDRAGGGTEDLRLRLKARVWRRDLGPVNTLRLSLLAGAEHVVDRTGEERRAWNPTAGLAGTAILGRHGLNLAGGYRRFTAGGWEEDGEVRADAAYLYRLSPSRYGPETSASWYAVSEWNARFRGTSEYDVRWVPGLLYEAWRWAAEVGAIVPLTRGGDDLERLNWGVVAGVRTLF